jgi:hypothetical protein
MPGTDKAEVGVVFVPEVPQRGSCGALVQLAAQRIAARAELHLTETCLLRGSADCD